MLAETVAVIGLGSMGMGMAQSLLRAGAQVAGCDVNAEAVDRLRDGARISIAQPPGSEPAAPATGEPASGRRRGNRPNGGDGAPASSSGG